MKVERLANFPGVAYVRTPEGERIELFENAATNLTFTVGGAAAAKGPRPRHNAPVAATLAFHHVHLYLPDAAAVTAAKEWYAKMFGGVPGKRSNYDAVDLPGINFNFSANPDRGEADEGPDARSHRLRGDQPGGVLQEARVDGREARHAVPEERRRHRRGVADRPWGVRSS